MNRNDIARGALLLDALGCLFAGVLTALIPAASRIVDPTGKARIGISLALVCTGLVCAFGTKDEQPRQESLTLAAVINLSWVVACLTSLRGQRTGLGRFVLATTAVLDGAIGAVQWLYRKQDLD